ncbi:hypothetical protein FC695_04955, partial [Bacillus cereus]
MKKVFSLFAVLILAMNLFGFSNAAHAQGTNQNNSLQALYEQKLSNLTAEQINDKFAEIDKSYAIGEPFSLEDETFIKMYAKNVNAPETYASKKIS